MKNDKKQLVKNRIQSGFPIASEEADGCLRSIAWTHRALGTGLAVLGMSNAELKAALQDEERFCMIGQIFKMLLTDQKYADYQAEMRNLAIDRITHALVERNHPGTEQLIKSDIDFDIVPEAPGLSAEMVNAVRPSKTH